MTEEVAATDFSRLAEARHPGDAAPILAAMAESARTWAPFHVEFRVKHPQKGELWVETRAWPQPQPDKDVLPH